MKILKEKEKQNYLEWSEGNKYLYELLCICGENEITTFASCGGHEKRKNNAYLGLIINANSLPFIKSMLDQTQDMQNISITSDVRHSGNGELFNDEKLRALIFCAYNFNCCELFYKMKKGIESKDDKIALKPKMKRFYDSIEKLNETSRDELQEYVNNQIVVSSTISTKTQELEDYENSKKLVRNSSRIIRFFRKLLPFKKFNERKYEELKQKYDFLQRNYTEGQSRKIDQYKINAVDQDISEMISKKQDNTRDDER